MTEADTAPAGTRRGIVVAVTLAIGVPVNAWALHIPAGDPMFYLATSLLAVVWMGGAFASGPIPLGTDPRRPEGPHGPRRPIVSSAVVALALAAVFCLGALVVARIPVLRDPVEGLLEHATAGNLALVALLTAVNGVAEECFHRGAVFDAARGHRPVVLTTIVYALVTATSGNPLLVFAAILLGVLTALQRRVTGGVLGPVITHVTWSMVMLFALGPILHAAS